jgi:hypothetical protein
VADPPSVPCSAHGAYAIGTDTGAREAQPQWRQDGPGHRRAWRTDRLSGRRNGVSSALALSSSHLSNGEPTTKPVEIAAFRRPIGTILR